MLDLCLINPARPYLVNPTAQAHLGLMCLAGQAEHWGYSVKIVDLASRPDTMRLGGLPQAKVYGVTGTFLDVPQVRAICQWLRDLRKESRVIVGGPIVLSADEFEVGEVDCWVHGEADWDIARFLSDDFKPGRFWHCETPSAWWDAMPARHLWPGSLGGQIFSTGDKFSGGSTVIESSRGCVHKCAFCASHSLRGRGIRKKPVEVTVREMEEVVEWFGVKQFRFNDEYINGDREHIEQLCLRIMKSPVLSYGRGIAWRASAACKPNCDYDLFKLMNEVGCVELGFGVESGDQRVLDLLGCGKVNPGVALRAADNARSAGIFTRALMIVGCPGSREETGRLDRELIGAKNGFDKVGITVFNPVPGCMVWAKPEKFNCKLRDVKGNGLCLFGPDGMNKIEPMIKPLDWDVDELRKQMIETIEFAQETGKIGRG